MFVRIMYRTSSLIAQDARFKETWSSSQRRLFDQIGTGLGYHGLGMILNFRLHQILSCKCMTETLFETFPVWPVNLTYIRTRLPNFVICTFESSSSRQETQIAISPRLLGRYGLRC